MKQIIPLIIAATALTASIAQAETPDIHSGDIPAAIQSIYNPEIPDTLTFAGQLIDFDRVDMYERLDREVTSVTFGHGNTLLLIKRANRLFPEMAPLLKQAGAPEDLLYLACVESTLNPRAVSPAGAVGLWQFMPSTARQYGLEVNEWVDERYDIEKETLAAARYLLSAYARYGNWESAMAAYNAGSARISGQMESQLADTSFDLYLNEETSRYVFRILATKMVMENPARYGLHLTASQLYQPIQYTTIEVTGPVDDWAAWAETHGTTYAQLRNANLWIRATSLPNPDGRTYMVRIPTQQSLYRSTAPIEIFNKNWVSD